MLQQHSAAALTVLALAGGAFAGMTALKAQNAGVGTALVDRYVAGSQQSRSWRLCRGDRRQIRPA